MSNEDRESLAEMFRDDDHVFDAIREAVSKALAEHGRNGRPVAVGRDGKTIWIRVEDLPDQPHDQ